MDFGAMWTHGLIQTCSVRPEVTTQNATKEVQAWGSPQVPWHPSPRQERRRSQGRDPCPAGSRVAERFQDDYLQHRENFFASMREGLVPISICPPADHQGKNVLHPH